MANYKDMNHLRAIIARNKSGAVVQGAESAAPVVTKAKRPRKPKSPPMATDAPVRYVLTLPMPPSANRYWRNYDGVTVISDEARRYKFVVAETLRTLGISKAHGPLAVYMVFYFARRGADLDNRIKVTLDAMNGFCYVDDKQIDEIHARRRYDAQRPRVELVIESIVDEA